MRDGISGWWPSGAASVGAFVVGLGLGLWLAPFHNVLALPLMAFGGVLHVAAMVDAILASGTERRSARDAASISSDVVHSV